MTATTSRLRRWTSVLAAAAIGAGTLMGLSQAVQAASPNGYVQLVVSGRFDGAATTGVVAGTTYPTYVDPGVSADYTSFTFTATCSSATPCLPTAATTVVWDYGDGTSDTLTGTNALTTTHAFVGTGRFEVRASVKIGGNADATSVGRISALVSPRFADVDVSQAGKAGRRDRAAIWAASALGILDPCRAAIPQLDTSVSNTSTDVGRAMACPEPSKTYQPGTAPTMPAGATANGVTGVACTAAATACNLPVGYFIHSAAEDPTKACDASCLTALKSASVLDASSKLAFDGTNCGDGWTAARSGGAWTVVRGSEPGCATRDWFYSGLAELLDGHAPTAGSTATQAAVCGSDTGPAPSAGFLRAARLLGTAVVTRTRSSNAYCDTDATITKAEAFSALAAATGLSTTACPAPSSTELADLTDVDLGYGTAGNQPHPACGAIRDLLRRGVPAAGDVDNCVSSTGNRSCFRPDAPITRGEASRMFLALVPQASALGTSIGVNLTTSYGNRTNRGTSAVTVPSGTPVPLAVTVTLPAYYPVNPLSSDPTQRTQVTLTWPTQGTGESTNCNGTSTTVEFGTTAQVALTGNPRKVLLDGCTWTRTAAGSSSLVANVSIKNGSGTVLASGLTATLTLLTSTSGTPVLASDNPAAVLEGTSTAQDPAGKTQAIFFRMDAYDSSGQALTFSLRSWCDNNWGTGGCSDLNNFHNQYSNYASKSTTSTWTSTYGTPVNVGVGHVELVDPANVPGGLSNQSAMIRVVPEAYDAASFTNASADDTYGFYWFAVKACNAGTSQCAERLITGQINATNDAPMWKNGAVTNTFTSTVATGATVQLFCPDGHDNNTYDYNVTPADYPSSFTYTLNALTTGAGAPTYQAWNGSAWVPATAGVNAVNGLLKVTHTGMGTDVISYTCTDGGYGVAGNTQSAGGTMTVTRT